MMVPRGGIEPPTLRFSVMFQSEQFQWLVASRSGKPSTMHQYVSAEMENLPGGAGPSGTCRRGRGVEYEVVNTHRFAP
jgi:hypothetical protein